MYQTEPEWATESLAPSVYAREIYDEHLAETIEKLPEIVAMNTIRCDTVAGLNTVVHLWLLEKGVKATDYLLECLCRWRMAVEVSFLRTDNRYNVRVAAGEEMVAIDHCCRHI